MFCIYLGTNSDLCHLQHKLIGFYNPDEKCLQRGTDWVFKSDTEFRPYRVNEHNGPDKRNDETKSIHKF